MTARSIAATDSLAQTHTPAHVQEPRVRVPLFVSNVSEDEDFGVPPGINSSLCSICYDPDTRTKFMGERVRLVYGGPAQLAGNSW